MSSLPRRSPARPVIGRSVALGLGLVVLLGLAPGSAAMAASPKAEARLQPTIHYEQAQAHAGDRTDFKAGDRVTVPFRPRTGDRWKVGGQAPRTLPAGRASGREMRLSKEAKPAPDATIDRPSVDPSETTGAIDASWIAGTTDDEVELTAAVGSGGLRREIFGFLPYWELGDTSTRLDWAKLSTVAYFGVGADGQGNLQKKNSSGSTTVGWSGWTSSRMTNVINAAHASGARVVLTVQSFAWSSAGQTRQKALLGSSTARANLAAQIARAVRDRGADGVNLDFEPLVTGYADEFTALVRKVRSALDASARGYQLTFDTTGYIGNYPIENATAAGGADAIMIMGYDYRTARSSVAGSIAPLAGPAYDIGNTLSAFLARVPASKVILGVPYYGRAWATETDNLHSKNISGTKYGASSAPNYTVAREFTAQYGRRYDTLEGAAWTAYKRQNCSSTYGCVTTWRQLYYDDATALKQKYDLINARGLRGVGIWALGYDGTRTELYQALKDKFISAPLASASITGSSLSSSIISPNGDGRLDTTTARLTATGVVKWGYKVQPVSGTIVGSSIRSGSKTGTTASFTWDGKDSGNRRVTDGNYRLTLWAADASGARLSRPFSVTVDTRPPVVKTTIGKGYLSPDANGQTDTLQIAWTSSEAMNGTVRLIDGAGATVRKWTYDPTPIWSRTWTGADDAGTIVPDGRYTYRVNGRDRAGNRTIVDRTILVDRTLKLHRWSDYTFDPRGGRASMMTISLVRRGSVSASIYLDGTRIRRIWTDNPLAAGSYSWTWDGKTSTGAYAKPGTYRAVVAVVSKFGLSRWTCLVRVERH